MIVSMTGFGSAKRLTDSYSLKIELRTLNSKFFDCSLRLPKELSPWEIDLKNALEKGLVRGKVTATIDFQPRAFDELPAQINEPLFKSYFKKLNELSENVGAGNADLVGRILELPGVLITQDDPEAFMKLSELMDAVSEAIKNCQQFRTDEGGKLMTALLNSQGLIEGALVKVEELDPERISAVKGRITQALDDIRDKVAIDQNRFEQELIYYLEKNDITEEKVRLSSHLEYFREIVNEKEYSGKKLGFLAQELGREINTIGSKANHAGIQREVVKMKEELEKIKEQILNVL